MNINLEYYKFFYYATKCGSITQAAEVLSVTQPAVSQAIRALAKALGTELFVRNGKGVQLTPAGEVLYDYVKRGYEQIRMGERKMLEMTNMETGEIRIGASDMTLQFYLLPHLQRFHERYPGIRISVTNGPTPETMHYLSEGKIDFGLVTTPLSHRKGFQATPVRMVQDVFVAGERFRALKGQKIPWSRLRELPVVCLEKNSSTRSYVDEFLLARDAALHPEIELATSDMIVQFALRGLGVACVMRDFAAPYLERGELFELHFETSIPERAMELVTNEKLPLTSASAKFLELLEITT